MAGEGWRVAGEGWQVTDGGREVLSFFDFLLSFTEVNSISEECDIVPESDHSAVSLVLQSSHLNQKKDPASGNLTQPYLKTKHT